MSLRWRVLSVLFLVGLLGYLAASNFADPERRAESWLLPDEGLRLGLDLRGGIHMVIGPDLDMALGHELGAIQGSLESDLERKKITGVRTAVTGEMVQAEAAERSDADAIEALLDEYSTVLVSRDGNTLELRLTPEWRDETRERAMLQALEVLRRRVDDPSTGIPESVITRQGADRILVQIPGVSRVPDIFRRTGFLEFKMVQDVASTDELLRARHPDGLPTGTTVALEKDRETERVLNAYLVPEVPDMTGDDLSDARVQFDNRRSEWQVRFVWTAEAGRRFAELTEANVGEPMAILLDGEVYSAPVIQSRIAREGVITGRFSSQEASDLAIILRAGALPIAIHIEEERTIGPALGADSIRSGLLASATGLTLIVFFAIGYYRMSGGFASLGLLANLLMLVGLMSLFEGTLTLPGIAGLVLTVGMAVDANVIIFERIREELRTGRAPRAAIAAGFEKARWTILDANITTLITAIILYNYGTGPIKGFAVTLSVGILTSVFSALVITRLFYEWRPGQDNVAELSI